MPLTLSARLPVSTEGGDVFDQHLVRLIATRDVQAFEAFYDRHASAIYRLILQIVRKPAAAETVLHATFWSIWCTPPVRHRGGTVMSYLWRLARQQSLAYLYREQA